MRVLFITSSYPSARTDPRGSHIHRLAGGLAQEGISVRVVAPAAPGALRHEIMDGVQIHRVHYWIGRWQNLAVGLGGILPNIRARPWMILQVPPLCISLAWEAFKLASLSDVIHAHWIYPSGILAAVAAKRHKLPFVITSHGGDLNFAARSRILSRLCATVSRHADVCIGVSEEMCKQFLNFGISPDRIYCLPIGVDTSGALEVHRWALKPPLQTFGSFQGFKILYVGSLIPRKSVDTLLRAHHRLELAGYRAACAVVGPGPCDQMLKDLARDLNLQSIFFAGAQPPDTIPGWLANADAFVMPSLSEGRPVALMEAMAHGLAVVGSDIPGIRELLKNDGNGLLFKPRNVVQLAACLERLIKDDEVRQTLGQNAMASLTKAGYTTSNVVRQHISIYQKLLLNRNQNFGVVHL